MIGRYPDKPFGASDGESFAVLGASLVERFLGVKVNVFATAREQFEIGESAERVEFKELKNSRKRLHIEIAERTSVTKPWVQSGIMRADNTVYIVCGNEQEIIMFKKSDLRDWLKTKNPKEVWYGRLSGLTERESEDATIRSFVLEKEDARAMCLCRFVFNQGVWEIVDGWFLRGVKLQTIRDELASGLGGPNRRRSLWLTLDWLVAKQERAG